MAFFDETRNTVLSGKGGYCRSSLRCELDIPKGGPGRRVGGKGGYESANHDRNIITVLNIKANNTIPIGIFLSLSRALKGHISVLWK